MRFKLIPIFLLICLVGKTLAFPAPYPDPEGEGLADDEEYSIEEVIEETVTSAGAGQGTSSATESATSQELDSSNETTIAAGGGLLRKHSRRHLVEIDVGGPKPDNPLNIFGHNGANGAGSESASNSNSAGGGAPGGGGAVISSGDSSSSSSSSGQGSGSSDSGAAAGAGVVADGGGGAASGKAADIPTDGVPEGGGEEAGFFAGLQKGVKENVPFITICTILLIILFTICCCFAFLIRKINRKPDIANISEEFKKMKEEERQGDLQSSSVDGSTDDVYPHSGLGDHRKFGFRSRSTRTVEEGLVSFKPLSVKFAMQGIPEEPSKPAGPEMVSDERLRQIEREIRELENSMKATAAEGNGNSIIVISKELENLSSRPDQLRELETLTSKQDELRTLQTIVHKPEEIRGIGKLTTKSNELKDLELIVGENNSKQLKEIQTIVQYPHELEQISGLVQNQDRLNELMGSRNLEIIQESMAEPIYGRQLSEKSEAIAKLDRILEKFGDVDDERVETNMEGIYDTRDITEVARRQARTPSGVLSSTVRGSLAVNPVPAFKRTNRTSASRENITDGQVRTKPTISLYSTVSPPRAAEPQFPPTGRRIPAPRESVAFGSRVSSTPPTPLKARTGYNASMGRSWVVNTGGGKSEFENYSDSDLSLRAGERGSLPRRMRTFQETVETHSNQDLRKVNV